LLEQGLNPPASQPAGEIPAPSPGNQPIVQN